MENTVGELTKEKTDLIISNTIKKSFTDFCNSQKRKNTITQENFDLLHAMRDWIIDDLNKAIK